MAVSAFAAGFEHRRLARVVSTVVGVNGEASTFEAIACEISVCASDTRRKPFSMALFEASVTTQT